MEPGWFWDAIRNMLSFFDSAGYTLVSAVYNVFFTVANAQIFSGDVIDTFFSRIQLILGVFMIFNLTLTALNIIINPDTFKDKEKGAGKILMRVALSLVMLSLVVPIDIPNTDGNPLSEQISSNGILFGFLYQFQNSVMQDNILGKLILGSNTDSNAENYGDLDNMSDIGGTLATTVAKAFISPALKDTSDDPDVNAYEITEDDVLCPEAISEYNYNDSNLSYKSLIRYINVACDSDEGEVYIFDYTPLLGLVCSIIMAVIIIGFTLDVAVRAIKLALLRLIAPIPIISYVMPGQEKNGAFGNWVKTLASTYMDLFLRIIIIYFGAYVILIISEGGITIWQNSPGFFTSLFSSVFLIIGVLVFMKQAPKFFQDMLGLKGDGKLFSGIGTMLGAAALTGGLVGSMATNARASWEEDTDFRKGGGKGRAALSALKAVGSAGIGGIGGAFVGAKTLASTDKKVPSSVFSAMQRRNAARASGVTTIGKAQAGISALVTGRAMGAKEDKALELLQAHVDAQKGLKDMVDEQSLKSTTETGTLALPTGERLELNYSNFDNMRKNAIARGERYMDVTDVRGRTARVDLDTLDPNVMKDFEESQASNLLMHQRRLTPDDDGYDIKIHGKIQEAEYAATNVQEEIDLYDYSSVKGKGIGGGLNAIRDIKTSRKKDRYRANSKAINANEK